MVSRPRRLPERQGTGRGDGLRRKIRRCLGFAPAKPGLMGRETITDYGHLARQLECEQMISATPTAVKDEDAVSQNRPLPTRYRR